MAVKKKEENQTHRVWAYLTPEEDRRLRTRLAAMNLSVSEWVRDLIMQFLDQPMPDELLK